MLGVSTSGYYHWRRGPSARARADQALLGQITRIYKQSGDAYGAPRVHAELQIACGVRVGRKRVARLMRSAGLVGCHRRRRWRPGLTRRDPRALAGAGPVPAQVQPTPAKPHVACRRHRAAHRRGTLYLVAVIDGCSRMAVGTRSVRADAELAIAAVELGSAAARSTRRRADLSL